MNSLIDIQLFLLFERDNCTVSRQQKYKTGQAHVFS